MLKTESDLSETTERAAALLQELRLRLKGETSRPDLHESSDELERELQAYFSTASYPPAEGRSMLSEIRDRVVVGVVDRIIRAWEEPRGLASGAIEEAVVERLIERVLQRLGEESIASKQSGRAPLTGSATPR